VELNHPGLLQGTLVPTRAIEFSRAFFRSEIHAQTYSRVRTRCSTNIEVSYENGSFYGVVHKFLKVTISTTTLRLALVSTYYNVPQSSMGVVRVNRNQTYKTGKVIEVSSVERKIMLVGGPNPTSVLLVPHRRSL